MKNNILVTAALMASLSCFAQESIEPVLHPGVYAVKISPNGKWVGSMAGDASVFNVETGENMYHSECFIGLGNAVANNGMTVGNAHDVGVLMYNGSTLYPDNIGGEKYWFCDINAITPDATRICGIINNVDNHPTLYLPFVAEVDANGNVGEPTILPYPELDFFGAEPEYVTAVWMSEDGNTIVGQVLDWRGLYTYPIYYTRNSSGEWSYTLPSESLFNPTHIELPQNPWLNEPEFPDPEDFLSGTRKDAYNQAMQEYLSGSGTQPDPLNYMTPEQVEAYEDAVIEYNTWYYSHEQEIQDYINIYKEVLKTSPSFADNELTIDPAGKFFVTSGGVVNEDLSVSSKLFKFGITSDEIESMDMPDSSYYPSLVLPDGTIILSKPKDAVPNAYLLLPGADEYITLQQYFEPKYPEISEWLDVVVPGGTGLVAINADQTVITGALIPDQLAEDIDTGGYYYSSYIIQLGEAGIEQIIAQPQDGIYRVYDLNGVKVLETTDASTVNNLPKGIYIINGKKIFKQ